MNDVQIYENTEFEFNGDKLAYYISYVNHICRLSTRGEDYTKLLNMLNESKHLIIDEDLETSFLEGAVCDYIFRTWLNIYEITEKTVVNVFKDKIEEIIPNAKITNKDNDQKHKPDCWVLLDGEEIPVEAKLDFFNITALRQLKRYMSFYKKNKGIAVARKLTVELPENITFVNYTSFIKINILKN